MEVLCDIHVSGFGECRDLATEIAVGCAGDRFQALEFDRRLIRLVS